MQYNIIIYSENTKDIIGNADNFFIIIEIRNI